MPRGLPRLQAVPVWGLTRGQPATAWDVAVGCQPQGPPELSGVHTGGAPPGHPSRPLPPCPAPRVPGLSRQHFLNKPHAHRLHLRVCFCGVQPESSEASGSFRTGPRAQSSRAGEGCARAAEGVRVPRTPSVPERSEPGSVGRDVAPSPDHGPHTRVWAPTPQDQVTLHPTPPPSEGRNGSKRTSCIRCFKITNYNLLGDYPKENVSGCIIRATM